MTVRGNVTKTGGVVSTTVTVNDAGPVLPCVSVALQFTVVVPTGNVEPDGGVQETGSVPSTVSVALGREKVTLAPAPELAWTVMVEGTPLMTGGIVSWTVTVNDEVAVLPCASLELQLTVVVAIGNVEPDAGVQLTGVGPSTASVALGRV